MRNDQFLKSETDLAAAVIKHVESAGWATYPEVQVKAYGQIADIVASKDGALWVIECKRRLGLNLLDQIMAWRSMANLLSVAFMDSARPSFRHRDRGWLWGSLGIGAFMVGARGQVTELATPKLAIANSAALLETLSERHRTATAGMAGGGGRFSAYDATVDRLIQIVRDHPDGIGLKAAVAGIRHHYANEKSARTALGRDLRNGQIPEIEISRIGTVSFLRPAPVDIM